VAHWRAGGRGAVHGARGDQRVAQSSERHSLRL
jgi:hypothetical protein